MRRNLRIERYRIGRVHSRGDFDSNFRHSFESYRELLEAK